jgi:hypothetical protein
MSLQPRGHADTCPLPRRAADVRFLHEDPTQLLIEPQRAHCPASTIGHPWRVSEPPTLFLHMPPSWTPPSPSFFSFPERPSMFPFLSCGTAPSSPRPHRPRARFGCYRAASATHIAPTATPASTFCATACRAAEPHCRHWSQATMPLSHTARWKHRPSLEFSPSHHRVLC